MGFTTGASVWTITTRRPAGGDAVQTSWWFRKVFQELLSEAFPRPWGTCFSSVQVYTGRNIGCSSLQRCSLVSEGSSIWSLLGSPNSLRFSWVTAYGQSKGKLGEFLIEASFPGSAVFVSGLLLKIIKISTSPPKKFYGYWWPFLITA